MYLDCVSSGGDGDAHWFTRHFTLDEIMPVLVEYNSGLPRPFVIEIRGGETILWFDNQETMVITTDESLLMDALECGQLIIKR